MDALDVAYSCSVEQDESISVLMLNMARLSIHSYNKWILEGSLHGLCFHYPKLESFLKALYSRKSYNSCRILWNVFKGFP